MYSIKQYGPVCRTGKTGAKIVDEGDIVDTVDEGNIVDTGNKGDIVDGDDEVNTVNIVIWFKDHLIKHQLKDWPGFKNRASLSEASENVYGQKLKAKS